MPDCAYGHCDTVSLCVKHHTQMQQRIRANANARKSPNACCAEMDRLTMKVAKLEAVQKTLLSLIETGRGA